MKPIDFPIIKENEFFKPRHIRNVIELFIGEQIADRTLYNCKQMIMQYINSKKGLTKCDVVYLIKIGAFLVKGYYGLYKANDFLFFDNIIPIEDIYVDVGVNSHFQSIEIKIEVVIPPNYHKLNRKRYE